MSTTLLNRHAKCHAKQRCFENNFIIPLSNWKNYATLKLNPDREKKTQTTTTTNKQNQYKCEYFEFTLERLHPIAHA